MSVYIDEDGYEICSGCDKPVPREWCWNGRTDCPVDKAPRYSAPPAAGAVGPTASVLELAFWEAIARCLREEQSPLRVSPNDGTEPAMTFDGGIPGQVWKHMEVALSDIGRSAGVVGNQPKEQG